MKRKTIEQILEIEPSIQDIFDYANQEKSIVFSNWLIYEECKDMLHGLVGWGASKDSLCNSDDYETCIMKLSEILEL